MSIPPPALNDFPATGSRSPLVPLKQIPRVHLVRHVRELVAPAVGDDHVAAGLEGLQIVGDLGSGELRRVQRGLVDHHGHALGLHAHPAGALAPDQDEQRNRAHQPRDQEEVVGRRDLPRRQLGPHAGDGEAEIHSGARVGQEEVPGHVQAGGDGRAEGKGGGLEEDGAEDG